MSGKTAKPPPANAKGMFFEKIKTNKAPREMSKATFRKSKNDFCQVLS